jgi:TPP-dependent pyruvate/acetoin dehydrogenase alpha subunit
VEIEKSKLGEMYEKMLKTRKFEEKVAYFFSRGMVHGTTHLSVGEEATGIGTCCALEDEDLMAATHRGHGQCIGKGMDVNKMMAEIFGKETGYCKGKGGSMHIADLSRGVLGANGIVGGGIPVALGAGITTKMKNIDRVVVCFFGDGATNQGSFHESLNLASVWKLPVIFVCINNLYGMSTHISKSMNIKDISVRSTAYGIPGKSIDGNNVIEVYKAIKEAREYVRKEGPMLVVMNTYRLLGHSKSDANVYRTREEIEEWRKKCPIKAMRKYLEENKIFSAGELDEIEKKAADEIEKAVEFAKNSELPSVDTILEDVYA